MLVIFLCVLKAFIHHTILTFRCKGCLFHANQELPTPAKAHFKLDGNCNSICTHSNTLQFPSISLERFLHIRKLWQQIELSAAATIKEANLKWKNTTVRVMLQEAMLKTIIIFAYKFLLAID